MSKIMLVEDDNSLREIYEARLAAEGYTVVAAKDGEEALALALKEHPDLIIADVMMPKVSGFDMLDILRSTPETKNTKIIMMTALSQAEDKARAEKLGADRYLVKSQVTLEDVTREARTILAELDGQAAATIAKAEGTSPAPTTPAAIATPAPQPQPAPTQVATPDPAPQPSEPPTPVVTTIPVVAADDDDDSSTDDTKSDTAKDAALAKAAEALSQPLKKEEAEVTEQVDEFIASNPTLSDSAEPAPEAPPASTTASDAVDSLTKPAGDQPAEKPPEEGGRAYVANNEEKASDSLAHTKTIEPTPEATRASNKPNLNELLAKEGESVSGETTPAVDTIIAPNNTGGSPPAS